MTHDTDREPPRRGLDSQVQEMKDGITRMIEPHAMPGSNGALILALLELGIERRLRISPTERSAWALIDGVLKKVLARQASGPSPSSGATDP